LEDEECFLALAVLLHGAPGSDGAASGGAATRPSDGDGDAARRPRRRDGVRTLELGDELLLLERGARRVMMLDALGAEIWERCDGAHTVAAIADEIAGRVPGPGAAVRRDTAAAIAAL